jgi:hypothetical protein
MAKRKGRELEMHWSDDLFNVFAAVNFSPTEQKVLELSYTDIALVSHSNCRDTWI